MSPFAPHGSTKVEKTQNCLNATYHNKPNDILCLHFWHTLEGRLTIHAFRNDILEIYICLFLIAFVVVVVNKLHVVAKPLF